MIFPSDEVILSGKAELRNAIIARKKQIEILEYLLDYGFIYNKYYKQYSFYGTSSNGKKFAINNQGGIIDLTTDDVLIYCKMASCYSLENYEIDKVKEVISLFSELSTYEFFFKNRYYTTNNLDISFVGSNKICVNKIYDEDIIPLVYFSKTVENRINIYYLDATTNYLFPDDFDPKSNIFPINSNCIPEEFAKMINIIS